MHTYTSGNGSLKLCKRVVHAYLLRKKRDQLQFGQQIRLRVDSEWGRHRKCEINRINPEGGVPELDRLHRSMPFLMSVSVSVEYTPKPNISSATSFQQLLFVWPAGVVTFTSHILMYLARNMHDIDSEGVNGFAGGRLHIWRAIGGLNLMPNANTLNMDRSSAEAL